MPPESGGPVAGERLSGKFAVKGGGGPSRSGGVACVVAQIALASGARCLRLKVRVPTRNEARHPSFGVSHTHL